MSPENLGKVCYLAILPILVNLTISIFVFLVVFGRKNGWSGEGELLRLKNLRRNIDIATQSILNRIPTTSTKRSVLSD